MLQGLPLSKVLGLRSGHSIALFPALVLLEVPTLVPPPTPRVLPRSPASLYDAYAHT